MIDMEKMDKLEAALNDFVASHGNNLHKYSEEELKKLDQLKNALNDCIGLIEDKNRHPR